MAQVRVAVHAAHFDATHAVAHVFNLIDARRIEGSVVARPTAARVVLVIGREELGVATDAAVHAGSFLIVIRASEGALRAATARDLVLLRRELCSEPFVVFVRNPSHDSRVRRAARSARVGALCVRSDVRRAWRARWAAQRRHCWGARGILFFPGEGPCGVGADVFGWGC